MNKKTLDRLKKNPHYKVSVKQLNELNEEDRPEMTSFGVVDTHDSTFAKHDTNQEKVKVFDKRK